MKRRISKADRTGVYYHHERRLQPYTVWLNGSVMAFASTEEVSNRILKKAQDGDPWYLDVGSKEADCE